MGEDGFAGKGAFGLERRPLGRTGLEVSVLGFGAAKIGFSQTPQEKVSELLNSALDAGLDVIDTAECYAESEVLIGNAVSGRRDEYALFTKVGHWAPEGVDGWSGAGVIACIDRSLRRLKTDRVDLVQLHSCGVDVLERGEVIDALERARDAGKTRFIGYSGDSDAARWAVESGRFDTLMTSVSVFDQEALELTLPLCREREMGVIVKRAVGNAVWVHDDLPPSEYHHEYWRRMRKLDYDFVRSDGEGPDGPAGTSLRFVLGLEGVHTVVLGTASPDRLRQSAGLIRAGRLAPEKTRAIRERWKEAAEPGWVGQV